MFIELNMMIFFFQETYNNWLRERYGDDPSTHPEFDPDLWMKAGSSGGLDKIRFTGSPTLQLTTCERSVLLQPSGAPNLKSSWPCSKGATTYQRRTHNSKNNTEQILNNKEWPMKSFIK